MKKKRSWFFPSPFILKNKCIRSPWRISLLSKKGNSKWRLQLDSYTKKNRKRNFIGFDSQSLWRRSIYLTQTMNQKQLQKKIDFYYFNMKWYEMTWLSLHFNFISWYLFSWWKLFLDWTFWTTWIIWLTWLTWLFSSLLFYRAIF